MHAPYLPLAGRLKSLRESRGLSQRQLAALLGASVVTVWKWERGEARPREKWVQPLAQTLQISPEVLNGFYRKIPTDESGDVATKNGEFETWISEVKHQIANRAGILPEDVRISLTY